MGNNNCVATSKPIALSKKKRKRLPIETIFKLPFEMPSWSQGNEFSSGTIDLGELQVRQVSTFNQIWATHEGGQDNNGATFFEPSPIPEGFHMLGCYGQSNNKPLFGWTIVAKNKEEDGALVEPIDYSLVWSSDSLKLKREGDAYFWLPTPPDGYKATGVVITATSTKPPLDKVRCVRSDLTDDCEGEYWIWGLKGNSIDSNSFNVFTLRPKTRGIEDLGVPVGTFTMQIGDASSITSKVACLKNTKNSDELYSSMPSLAELDSIFKAYSPIVYFHPEEKYLPSSVSWYFSNGVLLYKKGEESNPQAVDPSGSNLPEGGENDGEYWLALPLDKRENERIKLGDLTSIQVYLHAKAMFGGTFTDIAIWIFYPFNGPAKLKLGPINISLGKIGEHVGDWEHMTLRVSNFTGRLEKLYISEHSKGIWVNSPDIEFSPNSNKPVVYSSFHGHANYPKPGLVLQGSGSMGIRNDTARSRIFMDMGAAFVVVAAEYLGSAGVVEPPWLNYTRKWGPKIDYNTDEELEKVEKVLIGRIKTAFRKFVKGLPSEVFGEEGPTGPKVKGNWIGDEEY